MKFNTLKTILAALLYIFAGSYAQKTTSAFGERMRMTSKNTPSSLSLKQRYLPRENHKRQCFQDVAVRQK